VTADDRPDILLITIDQWRGDGLSCDGHPNACTPNIDALAAQGVRFARHYAQAAPCGPSRASLLTGTYLHTHRSVGNGTPLDSNRTNLALEVAAAGYAPTLFGYTDTTVDPRAVTDPDDPRLRTYEGILPGFEVEVNLPEDVEAWGAWLRAHGIDAPAGAVTDTMYRRSDPGPDDPGWGPTPYPAEYSEAAFLVERFGQWLARQDTDEPLFAHVTFLRPHPPYLAPAPWHALVDPAAVKIGVRHESVEAEGAQHPMVAGALLVDQARSPEDDHELRCLIATYWGMLAEVDHQLGRLLDQLDRTGRAERTIVVLTADHGEQLGDHRLLEKLGYFDSSYHIPMVVAGPIVAPEAVGRVVEEFTENIDIMPTLLSALGRPRPAQCQGADLGPFLLGTVPESWRDAVHWEWDFRDPLATKVLGISLQSSNLAVIRDRHRKYVHFAGLPPAFYDLDEDPGELYNLADDPSRAAEILHYAQRMLSWRMSSDDDTLASIRIGAPGMVDLRSV